MRIEAEIGRCEGHGMCAHVAPEVYALDDEGEVVLLHPDVPPELAAKAEAGARACPIAVLKVIR